jgi:hypothetical protein
VHLHSVLCLSDWISAACLQSFAFLFPKLWVFTIWYITVS